MSISAEIEPQTIALWPNDAPEIIESGEKEEIVHRSEEKLDRAIHNVREPALTLY